MCGALLMSGAAQPAIALPLDPAACDSAKQEQAAMTDVPPLMERGSEWARANASPDALRRVARWIELSEMLSFRCGRGVLSAETQRAAAAAALIENPPPEPAAPAAAKLNAVPDDGGDTPAGGPKAHTTKVAPASEAPAEKKIKAKPKPKPKPPADGAAAETPKPAAQAAAQDDPPLQRHKPKPRPPAAVPPPAAQAAPAPAAQ